IFLVMFIQRLGYKSSLFCRHGFYLFIVFYSMNWLQVSASTKLPEIDEREGNKFEPKMTNVFGLKAQQQTLEFILPGEGAFHDEAQFVQCGIEEALAPPFGRLPVARILFDVRLEPSLEDTLAIGFAVKPRIQVEHGPSHIEPRFTCDAFEVFQAVWQQHQVHLVNRRHRQGRQDVAVVVHHRDHFLPLLVFVAAVADLVPPFLATVLEPSPWSRERSNFLASSNSLTEAMKARSREPSSAQRANNLKTPV